MGSVTEVCFKSREVCKPDGGFRGAYACTWQWVSRCICAEIRLQQLTCLPACQRDWMRYRLLPAGCARLRRQSCSTVGHDSPTARDLLLLLLLLYGLHNPQAPAITLTQWYLSVGLTRPCLFAKTLRRADDGTHNYAHTIWSLFSRLVSSPSKLLTTASRHRKRKLKKAAMTLCLIECHGGGGETGAAASDSRTRGAAKCIHLFQTREKKRLLLSAIN